LAHIAYNLALGRQTAHASPLIVYALHEWDNAGAAHLLEDFPQAQFVHTIRDPISNCDGLFRNQLGAAARHFPATYILAPYAALLYLGVDLPVVGLQFQTRVIRFEDLHRDTEETMRDLSHWLGLSFRETLLDSTFNGIPWVVTSEGNAWSGRRLEQAQRRSEHLSRGDLALVCTLFYEHFAAWNWPCPRIFGNPIVRCIAFVSLLLVPMKMEIIAARVVFKRGILPALRRGNISTAIRYMLGVGYCRLRIIWLLVRAFFGRIVRGTTTISLEVDQPQPR
jgi:hypothetical protein